MIIVEIALAIAGAFVLGTFLEYFVHRAMHWGWLFPEGHKFHHDTNDPRTFFADLIDYGGGAAALAWFGFLVSVPVGIGWAIGALIYAILASYAHQLQHANAHLVFWMPRPVHRLHHNLDMKGHNFGILVDWWDRVFGTYQSIEHPTPSEPRSISGYFAIPWR
jgi:sterol desaturase/sphingolipid hydroxylase (fatty acid hydroxylase superfamily)